VAQNERRETGLLADFLRKSGNNRAFRHALEYAERVRASEGVATIENVLDEPVNEQDYDTGDEWEGQSCYGSDIDSSDYELSGEDNDYGDYE
jgi:hypothetical protein